MLISRENMKKRASMYRLLSRFFASEADTEFLEELKNRPFPKAEGELGEGYKLLQGWLAQMDEGSLEELAVD